MLSSSALMPLTHHSSELLNCPDLRLTQLSVQQIDDDDYVEHGLDEDTDCSDMNTDSESDLSDLENQENITDNDVRNECLGFFKD